MAFDGRRDREVAVDGGKQAERNQRSAARLPLLLGERIGGNVRPQHGERRVVHRDVDEVALTALAGSMNGGDQPQGHERSRVDVGDRDLVEPTGGLDEAAHGLPGGVEAGPLTVRARSCAVVAEPADTGVDDLRVAP